MLRIQASSSLCRCMAKSQAKINGKRMRSTRAGSSLRRSITRDISSTAATKKAALSAPLPNAAPKSTIFASTENRLAFHPTTKMMLPLIGNGAYMALASGFLMTDMLELRVLLVGGYSGLVLFHTLHERPLKIPLRWSAVFVAVNAAAACLLIADQWSPLTETEERLYYQHFERYLTRGQFQQLQQLATRQHVPAGTRLTSENEPCSSMYFLLQGQANVYHVNDAPDGNIATIEQGGFVNDVAFQRTAINHASSPVGAYGTVVTTVDCEVLVWDIATLKQHMASKPEMERSMNYCMSDHLVKSLLRQREARYTEGQV